ncbi:hypothetical protein [Microcystis sp.]|uniref:hypothetical protein n=1 Tax=Microcystis sp. TaxID=1127 RepID=UPI00391BA96E
MTLYSLEKLIEWKLKPKLRAQANRLSLYSLEKLIEWKLAPTKANRFSLVLSTR